MLQNLSYDLGDCTRWEYMFPNTDKPLLQIPETEDDIMDGLDDEEVWGYIKCSKATLLVITEVIKLVQNRGFGVGEGEGGACVLRWLRSLTWNHFP
jgi:hypothetical protein